ncbi:hypothetical protein ACPPVT_19085 [Angustibacter sp. McL0619]|uniref:hypothetical protein n=1 Tax=Angustibacter sp. McL0619 TaxID=3415676 RepID=UPI003CF2DAEA
MLAVVVAEGLAIVLLTVLVLGLLRSHALILRALHELGAGLDLERGGSSAPSVSGPVPINVQPGVVPATRAGSSRAAAVVGTTVAGEEATIPVRGSGRRTLIAFLTSGCSVCQTFWDELAPGGVDVPGDGRLVVVTKGVEDESPTRLRELAGPTLEVVQSSAAWTDYEVPGSPYFVYVEDGVITGEGSSTSWAQVRDLMSQAVDDSAEARRRAGRAGPGQVSTAPGGAASDRDDLPRTDRDLLSAGIVPGHPSLFVDPDADSPGRR